MSIQLKPREKIPHFLIYIMLIPLFVLLLFVIIIDSINSFFGNVQCKDYNKIIKLKINGLAVKKGRSKKKHDAPYLSNKDINGEIKKYYLSPSFNQIQESININDSLIKTENELYFVIKKVNGSDTIISYEYDCSEGDFDL
jgi:hypothetical protein